MFKFLLFGLCFSPFLATAQNDAMALAKEKACLGCHSVDQHTMSVPSYQKIAEKYRGDPGAVEYLSEKIRQGGKGVWGGGGRSIMPAFLNLNPSEIRMLVDWILSLKDSPAS
ncbi:MAG: c-type cytochrome [Limnohabitans sp.]